MSAIRFIHEIDLGEDHEPDHMVGITQAEAEKLLEHDGVELAQVTFTYAPVYDTAGIEVTIARDL